MAWIVWLQALASFERLWRMRKRNSASHPRLALEVLEDRLAPASFILVAPADVTPSDTFSSGSFQHNLDLVNPDASPGPLGARVRELRTHTGGNGGQAHGHELLPPPMEIIPTAATIPDAIPAETPTGIEQQPNEGPALQQTPGEDQRLPQQGETPAPVKAEELPAAPTREDESLSLKRRADRQETVTAREDQAEQVSDRVFTRPEQWVGDERMDSSQRDGQLFLVATAVLAVDGSARGRRAVQGGKRGSRRRSGRSSLVVLPRR